MTARDRYMILGLVVALLGAGFWFGVLSPAKKKATTAQSQVVSAKQAFADAQLKVTSGQKAQEEFRRDRTTIVKLGRVVPETDDIPTLLTQLSRLAKKYHVTFNDYSVSASGGPTTGAATAATGTASTTSTGATGSNSSTNAVAPLFPPGSVQVNGGLGRTPIQLVLDGTYKHLEQYLQAVQHFALISQKETSAKGRLLVVDGFSYAPNAGAGSGSSETGDSGYVPHPELEATLDASVYFAPPLDIPTASSAGAATTGVTPTPGATTSTGTATIGTLR